MSTTITKTAVRLTVALASLGLAAVWAPAQVGAAPPSPVDVSLTFDSDTGFSKICSFDVLIEVQGKTKVIELPTGTKVITTAPRQTVAVTNLDTGETLDLRIPGSSQFNPETGNVVFLGANLIIRNSDFVDVAQGLVYAKGRFTFVPGHGLTGVGNVTDVCALLAQGFGRDLRKESALLASRDRDEPQRCSRPRPQDRVLVLGRQPARNPPETTARPPPDRVGAAFDHRRANTRPAPTKEQP